MSWFHEQGIDGFTPVEHGGVTGGTAVVGNNPVQADPADPVQTPQTATPAFNPNQQVGHNGTINGMNREQYRDAWMSSGAKSMDDLRAFVAQHGGTVQSDNGMVMTPFGEALDMGGNARGSAAGNGSFVTTWGGSGGPSAPPPSAPAGGGMSLGAMGGGGSSAGAGGGGSTVGQAGHLGGSFQPFAYEDFKPPSYEDAANDPGYQFTQREGQRALTNAGSRMGMLASGDFAKGMVNYNQGLASTQYQNVYNRALGTNQANNSGRLGAFTANTNADLGYGNLDLGRTRAGNDFALGQGQLALGNKQADNSYALGQGNLGLGYYTADQNYALGQGNQNLGWAGYGLQAQGQQFNQAYSLANLGMNAAGQAGQYGSSYANNAGNMITGRGNAIAAGQAGAGAAYGNALGNIGNTVMGYGIYGGTQRTPSQQGLL